MRVRLWVTGAGRGENGLAVMVVMRVEVRLKVWLFVKCSNSLPRHAEHGVQSRRCFGSGAGGLSF